MDHNYAELMQQHGQGPSTSRNLEHQQQQQPGPSIIIIEDQQLPPPKFKALTPLERNRRYAERQKAKMNRYYALEFFKKQQVKRQLAIENLQKQEQELSIVENLPKRSPKTKQMTAAEYSSLVRYRKNLQEKQKQELSKIIYLQQQGQKHTKIKYLQQSSQNTIPITSTKPSRLAHQTENQNIQCKIPSTLTERNKGFKDNERKLLRYKEYKILIIDETWIKNNESICTDDYNCIIQYKAVDGNDVVKVAQEVPINHKDKDRHNVIITTNINFTFGHQEWVTSGTTSVGDICVAECKFKDLTKIVLVAIYILPNKTISEIIKFIKKGLFQYTKNGVAFLDENENKLPMVLTGNFNLNFNTKILAGIFQFLKNDLNLTIIKDPTIRGVFSRYLDEINPTIFISYLSYNKPPVTNQSAQEQIERIEDFEQTEQIHQIHQLQEIEQIVQTEKIEQIEQFEQEIKIEYDDFMV